MSDSSLYLWASARTRTLQEETSRHEMVFGGSGGWGEFVFIQIQYSTEAAVKKYKIITLCQIR